MKQRARPISGNNSKVVSKMNPACLDQHVTLGSDNGVKPDRLAIQLENNSRRPSGTTAPADYLNHIGSPTEKNFLSSITMQEATMMHAPEFKQNNSEPNNNDTDTIPEGGLSVMSFPIPDHAVLPNGISPRVALAENTSQFTHKTRQAGVGRTVTQPVVGTTSFNSYKNEQQPSENEHCSQDNSEGQKTDVVTSIKHGAVSTRHIIQEPLSQKSEKFDAAITGKAQTQESEVNPCQADEAEQSASRRLVTDSQRTDQAGVQQQPKSIATAEDVKSAEFAMCSFSVLNNAPLDVVSGDSQRTNPAAAVAAIQKQHILSGQLQLKQTSSVLTNGNANETLSQQLEGAPDEPLQVNDNAKKNQSRTVMDHQQRGIHSLANAAFDSDQRPNRPMEQHFDSADIRPVSVQPKQNQKPQISEQVVYNRLPKDYFMKAAEEQMDIDIAINDIKKLRQGFISYVHEEGNELGAPEDEIDQIDDFLDPQKFIERHFGAENPDIIFQEVITSVPDPPENVPVDELAQVQDDDDNNLFNGEDKTMKDQSAQGGFTEQNVTPDLWADFSSNAPKQAAGTKGANNNLITGETFLKDARIMDSSINQMNAMKQTVNQLGRPYNDDELAKKPENANVFPASVDSKEPAQVITVAMDRQVSDNMNMSELDKRTVHSQENMSSDKFREQAASEGYFSKQKPSTDQNMNQTVEQSSIAEIDITKRRKRKHLDPRNGRREPIKELKMADYFKPTQQQPSSIMNMSKASTAEDRATMAEHLSQQNISIEELETIQAEQKWREDMDARLERDILDNVDVNFIFNKGVGLTQGLLDPDRIYSVMNKLKELAYKQLQSGSDKINYKDIVQYLQNSEGFFAEEIISHEQRNATYAGEYMANEQTLEKTQSEQHIANEPAIVGLGDDEDEKKRRWTQCVGFLRNNPRLLLQMIPNPEDDEIELKGAIMVGRPRPSKKKVVKSTRPVQAIEQQRGLFCKNQEVQSDDTKLTQIGDQNSSIAVAFERPTAGKRFLAASTNTRKGPACGKQSNSVFNYDKKTALAQRAIKVRPNALKNRNYWIRKTTEPYDSQLDGSSFARLNYTNQVITPDNIEGLSSLQEDYQHLQQSSPDMETESNVNQTVNIQTICNPSNVELQQPVLSLPSPGNAKEIGEKIVLDDQQERLSLQKQQQSAALRPSGTSQKMKHFVSKTGPILSQTNSKVMLSSHSTDLHKNTLATRIQAMRIQSGKLPGQRGRSGQQMRARMQARGNVHSALQLEEVTNSFTQFPFQDNGGSSRPDTAQQFFTKNSQFKAGKWKQPLRPIGSGEMASMYNRAGYSFVERNQPIKTVSVHDQRMFRQNKRNMMKRVLSQDSYLSYNFNSHQRPSTAASGPAVAQTTIGTFRKPLASNQILQFTKKARSFNRHFGYNKQTYQTSGAVDNAQAVVNTNQSKMKTVHINQGSGHFTARQLEQSFEQRSPKIDSSLNFTREVQQIGSGRVNPACVPSIFRQSIDQNSIFTGSADAAARSNIMSDEAIVSVSAPKASMADAASQTATAEPEPDLRRNMDAQTDLKDVNMDLSPPPKFRDQSMQSHFGHALKSHVDWAYSQLCIAVLKKDTTWNKEHEKRVFMGNEIDVVLQMIKSNFQTYMQPDKLSPFHAKAMSTLKALLKEQGLDQLFQRYEQQYHEITVENALKILLRCQLVFSSRELFIDIFEKIVVYEMSLADAKQEIASKETYKLPLQELNEMRLKCGRMYEAGEKVLFEVKRLRADRKGQYSQPFIFKKKDLTLRIKNEISEMRQLLKVYRVKRSKDSENSDKPARFIVVTDDEVSEREEVRDSNYIGTDLYWENRFYQVRPFKKDTKEEELDGFGTEEKPL